MSDARDRRGSDGGQSAAVARMAPPGPVGTGSVGDRQAERIEVIGALASGVAHEFNNLLTIALGSLEQLRRQALSEPATRQLDRAEWSVRQAGRLAHQLLSFVRRDAGQPEYVDLNAVVGEFDKIMSHAAGDRIRLVVELCEQPLMVYLDPGQLELALLNLVRNASDAMSGGGSVIIRTANLPIDGGEMTAEVSVSDSGIGMAPEIAQRATASFFTTKPQGEGTGLGLWMVKRFVTACGGKLDIETVEGRGTTVKLIVPRVEPAAR